jgi:hypothetical protein
MSQVVDPPPDEVFQSDNVLNEIELELIWLGEESMHCLACPEFQFDFIYEYASPALKAEVRKLSRDDQSETRKVKQILRMDDMLVSRRFIFVRKYIRGKLRRGFRREQMKIVIAELRLMRRDQQSERHFPAMILNRSEASAVIEVVHVDTLKVRTARLQGGHNEDGNQVEGADGGDDAPALDDREVDKQRRCLRALKKLA